jgi:hypothetical protein
MSFVNQRLPQETNSFSAGQGILRVFWNPMFDYSVHKGLPLVAVLIRDPDGD